ncbi:ORC-CDC6 family AAA ATPase [Flavobacterium columnare]|uniref:Uncharacterized protein n=1 Tax=Flavobacterium columnare TaxID=996 RepID=A0AAI8GBF1_9FLAO|nr:hypothetical protein [Flavobacterium columnare]AMO20732.1 hypothetical protein UN65_10640 [Flavobacterium columnare]AUX18713.1 hypothetical protein AQ623_10800 [Flavobacterium columnare]QOG57796.1 hypothetical protein HUE29_10705 [Flavobacterium columnare]QOG60520.1 hypothetical protein HUE30_10705 [Flavobacterium columnare]QOG63240.1 hypothetical protein HUE31_10705 [Flavobacterium columnare]
MINPFNITKAVDYTDEELNKFWVDFPIEKGFKGIIKPTSEMPMIILGSKGSGKTHIMKHFSFSMQHIRWKENILNGIIEDGYFGVYLRCSGLNGFKFNGRGESEETWQDIFSYYLELWLSQLLLNNIIKLIENTDVRINEHVIALEILDLFDTKDLPISIKSLTHLSKYLNDLQKEIDYAINNRAFTNVKISENIKILTSPGKLIFGMPEVFSKEVKELKDVKFLYLLDEYENFTPNQQKYFNTLIRERKNPTCFKIGAKRYGIRTFETLSAGEEIKIGSEFEEFDLDDIFRNQNKIYSEFIKNICIKRLENAGIEIKSDELSSKFEKSDDDEFLREISKKEKKHLKQLSAKLVKVVDKVMLENIIKNISFEKDVFLERVNVLLFYREWNKNSNLLKASEEIKLSCIEYFNFKNTGRHHSVIDKHKRDIIDTLYRENSQKIPTYAGFENLIKISNGIPRHFLITMKHIFRWNEFYDVNIFDTKNENKISVDSQLNALADTTNWFIEDSRHPGKDGNKIKECIFRLCDYLRELRFSDTPPECSISTISIQTKVLPKEISEIIDFLEQYSYLIKLDTGRRDKNKNSRNETFQINGLLASEWELSISRRGIVDLNFLEIKDIFFPDNEDVYKKFIYSTKSKYNAPFGNGKITISLFD